MCEALMELMEPEINKIKENVREETTQQVTQQGIRNAIIALRVCGNGDIEIKNAIMKAYGVYDSEAESYLQNCKTINLINLYFLIYERKKDDKCKW